MPSPPLATAVGNDQLSVRAAATEEQLGESVFGVQGDVTNGDDLARLFATKSERHGPLDILV